MRLLLLVASTLALAAADTLHFIEPTDLYVSKSDGSAPTLKHYAKACEADEANFQIGGIPGSVRVCLYCIESAGLD
jgi:hypothetical protein